MNTSRVLGSLALVVLIGATAACSDDGKGSGDSISKAEFLTAANALCATFDGKVAAAQAGVVTEEDQLAVITDVVVPEMRATLTAIRALGFPDGDEALLDGLMDQTTDQLDVIAANPAGLLTATEDPFAAINAQLVDYGLVTCGS